MYLMGDTKYWHFMNSLGLNSRFQAKIKTIRVQIEVPGGWIGTFLTMRSMLKESGYKVEITYKSGSMFQAHSSA